LRGLSLPLRWVAVPLGAFLLLTAGLKAHALVFSPFAAASGLPRSLELAIIQFEVILGLWLLSGWRRPWAWTAAVIAFIGFAVMSGVRVLQGHSSCGCFGQVEVAPEVSFAVDLGALVALWAARPTAHLSWRGAVVLAGVLATMGAAIGGLVFWDYTPNWLARLRGDVLSIHPAVVDVGPGPVGSMAEVSVQLTNHGSDPVRIEGGTTTCSCLTTRDLPIVIHHGETASIRIAVRRAGRSGVFRHGYWLYTNAVQQPIVVAWFTGRVKSS
jgi:hypothetical protein